MLGRAGSDVDIHPTVQVFGSGHVHVGTHVRIDCFVVITAGPEPVVIGDYVHLAAGAQIFGTHGVEIGDYSCLSGRASVYSTSDDFTSGSFTNPTLPSDLRAVTAAKVTIGAHVVVGAGSVVMPGVTLGRGAAIGALGFVNRDVGEYVVAAGAPVRDVGRRDRHRIRAVEQEMARRNDAGRLPPRGAA
jgi:galactoside O-acetyltransferase